MTRRKEIWLLDAAIILLLVAIAIALAASPASAREHPSVRRMFQVLKMKTRVWERKPWFTPLVHAAIGAGTYYAIYRAGGPSWKAGVVGTGLVIGFKEGSDVWTGRDSMKSAALDGLEIGAGAAAVAIAAHGSPAPKKVYLYRPIPQ